MVGFGFQIIPPDVMEAGDPDEFTVSVPPIVPDGILVFTVVFVSQEITLILYLSL